MSTTNTTPLATLPTVEELEKLVAEGKLRHYTTGSERGYLSRKGNGHVRAYDGRYGKGFVHVAPRRDTTRYVSLYYYIWA